MEIKMTTDTPRTDAEWASTWQTERRLHELCQQLERELASSNAALDQMTEDAVNLRAEVERLRKQLQQAVDIAEEFWNNQKQAVTVHHEELADELALIKATLNPTNK